MTDVLPRLVTVPFNNRLVHLPQQLTPNESRIPSMMVQIGAGEKHLTGSTLDDYESYSIAYHMEYEIRRQAEYDQSTQLYAGAIAHLSDVVFAIASDTVQADIFNLLITSVPIDLIEFIELENAGHYNRPREIVSFTNCIITNARRYNTAWGRDMRNNVLLVAFRATQWAVRVAALDQGNRPMGTGAIDHRFESSAAS